MFTKSGVGDHMRGGLLRGLQLVSKSVRLDLGLLSCPDFGVGAWIFWVAQKLFAVCAIALGLPADVRVGSVAVDVRTLSDLGTVESCVLDVYTELVAPGALERTGAPVIVDVGANIGQFAAAVRLWSPGCRVFAFEPSGGAFGRLSRTFADTPEVRLYQTALGDYSGEGVLHLHSLSVMDSMVPFGEGYSSAFEVVTVQRLDAVLAGGPAVIDILKVDVEGFEYEVILGAQQTLRRCRYLLLELGLGRDVLRRNLELLAYVRSVAQEASIVRFGRPLGGREPYCQDVLLRLEDVRAD